MPVSRGEGDHTHIEVVREPDYEPERRRRLNRAPSRIPGRRRVQHADTIQGEAGTASAAIAAAREAHGIDPARLMVLSFEAINFDPREVFETRFGAWVVEERQTKVEDDQRYGLLVQFPDAEAVGRFQQEIAEYREDSGRTRALPPALRANFFDSLESVRAPSREDRVGTRLRLEGIPRAEEFYLDVDLWHPGSPIQAQRSLADLRELTGRYGGQVVEHLRTDSLLLAKVVGTFDLVEALLDFDAVARVDLPPLFAESYADTLLGGPVPAPVAEASDGDPLACVLDSGVVAGHPLLRGWVVEERDFESGEPSPTDENGHGTAVAGLVVYGDIGRCIETGTWNPRVRLCSAKVMRSEDDPAFGRTGRVIFPPEHRVEKVLEEAIRYFHSERDCRVFNLSFGDENEIYGGGRQFPLAEKLDELARELDIVIVISSGNCSAPDIPRGTPTREATQQAVADHLRSGGQRLCNPGTAALGVTVGAVARTDAMADVDGRVAVRDAMAGAPAGAPAPFTRTGPGYSVDGRKEAVKPELVHYGGNAALIAPAGGEPRWSTSHILLGEPTARRDDGTGRILTAKTGTSLAAPHVTHLAALSAATLRDALGRRPSANLIRAAVASSADLPPCGEEWLGNEQDRTNLVGYGLPAEERALWSTDRRTLLVAEDRLAEDSLHIYRLPVPASFLAETGSRGIIVALAFDPPVRASRKEYLARTMWFDLLQGLTPSEIEEMKGKYAGEEQPSLPSGATLGLRPTKTHTAWSTLQVRRKSWKQRPRLRTHDGTDEPVLHLVVGCQKRFETGLDPLQQYGLIASLWHEGERVHLYQELRALVRVPAVRVRAQV